MNTEKPSIIDLRQGITSEIENLIKDRMQIHRILFSPILINLLVEIMEANAKNELRLDIAETIFLLDFLEEHQNEDYESVDIKALLRYFN